MSKIIEVNRCAWRDCPHYGLQIDSARAVCTNNNRYQEIDPVVLRGAFPSWCPLEDKPVEKLEDVEQHF